MSALSIIPVPIGNIGDITIRAKKALEKSKIILAEDTRVTKKLLRLLDIDYSGKKFISYFEHVERKKLDSVIELLKIHNAALVSDAGTPLLSDPGFPLVREIRQNHNDIEIEVLPGATSITTALVSSGFPPDKFTFMGYVSRKPSDRKKMLRAMSRANQHIKSTYVLFETTHRLIRSLEEMNKIFGAKVEIALCHELTKMYESVNIGTPEVLLDQINRNKNLLKGEIVLVVRFI